MSKRSINHNQVRIKSSATELMTHIFAHILRNSIDHGIETPTVLTFSKAFADVLRTSSTVKYHTIGRLP